MRCRLTRVDSVHQNLRTDEVVGMCPEAPALGAPFMMSAPPLDPDLDPNAAIRMVETTKVVKMTTEVVEVTSSEKGKVIEFETENSVYKWELLDDETRRLDEGRTNN